MKEANTSTRQAPYAAYLSIGTLPETAQIYADFDAIMAHYYDGPEVRFTGKAKDDYAVFERSMKTISALSKMMMSATDDAFYPEIEGEKYVGFSSRLEGDQSQAIQFRQNHG